MIGFDVMWSSAELVNQLDFASQTGGCNKIEIPLMITVREEDLCQSAL